MGLECLALDDAGGVLPDSGGSGVDAGTPSRGGTSSGSGGGCGCRVGRSAPSAPPALLLAFGLGLFVLRRRSG